MHGKTVTVKDVAARAGVSIGTVSNVVNRPEKVSAATVRRVQEAIRKLGWTPHQGAQQLGGGRSAAVGVVVGRLSPHTIEVLDGVQEAFEDSGLVVQVMISEQEPEREISSVELFEQQRARGILLSPAQDYQPHLQRLRQLDIPLVLFGLASTIPDLCSVSGDDVAGGRLAAAHLVERGHRHLAVVGGTASTQQVQDRIAGARSAVGAGARLDVIRTTEYDTRAGLAAADHLAGLPAGQRPTAVFAINDSIALGVQRGLQAAGLDVPGDVAVIGYDDSDIAQTAPVSLTTIRVSNERLGRWAARLLLEELTVAGEAARHQHRQRRLEPKLIIRDST